jgi:UDP-2,3-diacylglucosamine pyrophosphatase LpxH
VKKEPRHVDTVVISDVHLGTYGCHAKELVQYLRSIRAKRILLNGDIIDIWQFSKSYFPSSHMKVLKELMRHLSKGTEVYYIPGNHDEMLRKFVGQRIGNLVIDNKVVLDLDGKKTWVFHGDVFDVSMKHSKWIAKLGGMGYDLLILFNRGVNMLLEKMGREKVSLSKKVKDSVKAAIAHVNDFENTVSEIGIENGYDHVICGHIHRPEISTITTERGSIEYMNSGDWVENLTSLEYDKGEWSLYVYDAREFAEEAQPENDHVIELTATQLYAELLTEFNIKAA